MYGLRHKVMMISLSLMPTFIVSHFAQMWKMTFGLPDSGQDETTVSQRFS